MLIVKCTMHLDRSPDDFVGNLIHPVHLCALGGLSGEVDLNVGARAASHRRSPPRHQFPLPFLRRRPLPGLFGSSSLNSSPVAASNSRIRTTIPARVSST